MFISQPRWGARLFGVLAGLAFFGCAQSSSRLSDLAEVETQCQVQFANCASCRWAFTPSHELIPTACESCQTGYTLVEGRCNQ